MELGGTDKLELHSYSMNRWHSLSQKSSQVDDTDWKPHTKYTLDIAL